MTDEYIRPLAEWNYEGDWKFVSTFLDENFQTLWCGGRGNEGYPK